MKIVKGDIFDHKHKKAIIVHSVNCQGKMASGIAKTIREKYPRVYEWYMNDYRAGKLELGYVRGVAVAPNLLIANICGQEFYGYDGKQYTSYHGLGLAFYKLKDYATKNEYDILLPYGIGCGLGGADWDVVSQMIEDIFGDRAYVYQKEEV